MKKFITFAVLAVASLAASAQSYVGGSVLFDYDSSAKTTTFGIEPEYGYYLNDKMDLVFRLGDTYVSSDYANTNLFSVGAYARYTFLRAAENRLKFFVDGGFDIIAGSKTEDIIDRYGESDGSQTTSFNFWHIGFKPGISYSLTKHWTLMAHFGFIGYQGANKNAEAIGYHKDFTIGASSEDLSFGIYYVF